MAGQCRMLDAQAKPSKCRELDFVTQQASKFYIAYIPNAASESEGVLLSLPVKFMLLKINFTSSRHIDSLATVACKYMFTLHYSNIVKLAALFGQTNED